MFRIDEPPRRKRRVGFDPYCQEIVKGIIIAAAAAVMDLRSNKRRK